MLRRALSLSVLLLGTALATGCPTPPEQAASPGGGAPPPQGGPAAGGGGGGGGGGAAPNGGGGPPPAGGNAGGGNAGGGNAPGGAVLTPPSFKDIISGDTLTITINVTGGTKGQIDFMTMGEGPTALHVEPFEGQGPFEITAPARYDQDVYVTAMNYSNGNSIGVDDPTGAAQEPIKLQGKDVTLSVEIGKSAEWFKEPSGDMPPPQGAGGPPAGGGDAPGGPPPGGAAGGPPPGGDAGGPPPGGDAGGPPPGGDAGGPPPGGDAGAPPSP